MLPRNWLVPLALLFSLAVSKNAFPQAGNDSYTVHCGDMLKIVMNRGAEFQGKLYSNNDDSLMIFALPEGLRVFAKSDISTISRCRRKTAEGAIYGSLVGLAVGLVWGASLEFPYDSPKGKAALAVGGTALGALFGALTGSGHYKCTAIPPSALPECTSRHSEQETALYISFAVNW